MKAVVTVIGKDSMGIIAKVSAYCAKYNANILDISQTVLQDYFAMIMLVEIDSAKTNFATFADELEVLGTDNNLIIHTMHEDIFNSMHKI